MEDEGGRGAEREFLVFSVCGGGGRLLVKYFVISIFLMFSPIAMKFCPCSTCKVVPKNGDIQK